MRLHSSRDVAPGASVVKSDGHLLHVELMVCENVPLGHGRHSVSTICNPGGHLHELMPTLFGGDKVPRGHALQVEKS